MSGRPRARATDTAVAAIKHVEAVRALAHGYRWQRHIAARGERDALPARPQMSRGGPEGGVEVRARVHGADDVLHRQAPETRGPGPLPAGVRQRRKPARFAAQPARDTR